MKALYELDGCCFKLVLLACCTVQIEKRQPGVDMLDARSTGLQDFQQTCFRAGVVAIGK